jgi:hypothetical protein
MTSIITQYALDAIDRVKEYPHIVEYIRSFDKEGGYTYKNDDEERERKILKKQMDDILDNGKHTGPSTWEYMTTLVRLVLSEDLTCEDLIKTKTRQEKDEADLSHVIEKIWIRNQEIKKERKFEIIKHAIELQKTAEAIMQTSSNSPSQDIIEELKNAVQIFHNATNRENNTTTIMDKVIVVLKKELVGVLKSIQASKEITTTSSQLESKQYGEEVYERIVNETLLSAEQQTPEFLRAVMQSQPFIRKKAIQEKEEDDDSSKEEHIQHQELQQQALAPPTQEVLLALPAQEVKTEKAPKEPTAPKIKAPKEPKVKAVKAVKAVKEPKEPKEPKAVKEPKSPKEPKAKAVKEPKAAKEPKAKAVKETKETKEVKE